MDNFLRNLLCSDCESSINWTKNHGQCKKCKRIYPIKNRIVNMLDKKDLKDQQNLSQQEYYDREYDSDFANKDFEWRKRYFKRLYEFLPEKKNTLILDVASGQGYMTLKIAKLGYKLIATDISILGLERSYRHAKKEGIEKNILFIAADLNRLVFKRNTFNFYILLHVLEHIKNDKALVKNLIKYSEKKARFFIGVPISLKYTMPLLNPFYIRSDKNVGHQRRYTPDELKNLFKIKYKVLYEIYSGHLIKIVGALLSLFKINHLEKTIEDIDERMHKNIIWSSNLTMVIEKNK